jgi:hypothetical protein
MNDSKKTKKILAPLAGGALLLLALIVLLMAFSSYHALIRDSDGNFFRARALFIAGDALVCVRDTPLYTTRQEALGGKQGNPVPSFLSMKKIDFIEMVQDQEEAALPPGWRPTLQDYVGDYVVNAAGNRGHLSLRAGKGAIYGSIRFPEWGKGATEYLKNVRIADGMICFTRSAVTPHERSRLGVRYNFVQVYSGEYRRSGNLIRGFYSVNGERKQWSAVKTR